MSLHTFAAQRSISELSDRDLGRKNLRGGDFCYMPGNSTPAMEELYPCISVKNIAFHNCILIRDWKSSVGWPSVIAMLHHIIVLFTFWCLRPRSCQLEELSLAILCRGSVSRRRRHDKLVSQPLFITLRERKTLEIAPQIVQCKCCHKNYFCFNAKLSNNLEERR